MNMMKMGARTSAEQRERPQKTLIKVLGVWAVGRVGRHSSDKDVEP